MAVLFPSLDENSRVLVCEGESDVIFLNGMMNLFSMSIFVFDAGGKNNISAATRLFKEYPTIYIRDRDFDLSTTDAENTLIQQKRKTVWPRFDMEGYLLYPDWILQATQQIADSPKGKRLKYHVPKDETDIEQAILMLAQDLSLEYAGRQTLYDLRGTLSFLRNANQMADPKKPMPQTLDDWAQYIRNKATELQQAAQQIAHHPPLTPDAIQHALENNDRLYQQRAQNLAEVQVHFSGKTIFQGLAQRWGCKYKWELLRDEVIKIAVADTKNWIVSGNKLRHHPRLSDVALLVEKSLADGIEQ